MWRITGNKPLRRPGSGQRLFAVLVQQKIRIDQGGLLIKSHRKYDIPSVLGIKGCRAVQLQSPGGLTQGQMPSDAKPKDLIAAGMSCSLTDLVVIGFFQAASFDQIRIRKIKEKVVRLNVA